MDDWRVELLRWAVSSAGASLILGGIVFFAQEKWKAALAKALALEVEAVKAQAQRDLEAYKVGLVADVERHKARADIERQVAAKHALRGYDVLRELHASLSRATTGVLVRAAAPEGTQEGRNREYQYTVKRCAAYDVAIGESSLYLEPEQRVRLLDLAWRLRGFARDNVLVGVELARPENDETLATASDLNRMVEGLIRGLSEIRTIEVARQD